MDRRVLVENNEEIFYSSLYTQIGTVYIAKNNRGVCRISFPHETDKEFGSSFLKNKKTVIHRNNSMLQYEIEVLRDYFAGKKVLFDFSLDLSAGTPFQKKVWRKLQEIPYGEHRTYKWVAEEIGQQNASRAIGLANNRNPLPLVIPCHRVIGSNGKLTGYAAGLFIKKYLLDMERQTTSCLQKQEMQA